MMNAFTAKVEWATESEIEEAFNQATQRFHGIAPSPAVAVLVAEEMERLLRKKIRVTVVLGEQKYIRRC